MTENLKVVIPQFGEPEVLRVDSFPIPEPAKGEVLVKVHFSGVNPIDVKTRAGLGWAAESNRDNLPWTPGYDICGKVVSIGEGVEHLVVGDNVAGLVGFPLSGGGYSQYLSVEETQLSLVPDAVMFEAAAALPVAGQTAAQAVNKAQIQAGERVLILAGAGGVGHIAVQLAVAAQAEVYTTCSEANLDYLATLGAHAVNYQFAPVSERVNEVDVLIDLVGGDAALDALKCLRDNARVITIPTITKDMICEKATTLGFTASGMLVEPNPEQMDALLYMVSVGLLKVDFQPAVPFRDVAEVHKQIETGHTRGKLLLDMQC
ncbi:NADP-dependent oxidoreductase [Vibrio sp. SCSIO 43137]|uniref:NADP-dependent oxidoreductase n=1 Tax=Vibrio sp. SCSIO 43137 TaxID=3021011 RepID=UPI0023072601|nr:NADP-dependent oxidoreductase [Vibrio sp. SCSIO 43137]WCE29247.1 NADP-dependent oxidoreductase [Vibrio sp. SCSIO 43137]